MASLESNVGDCGEEHLTDMERRNIDAYIIHEKEEEKTLFSKIMFL